MVTAPLDVPLDQLVYDAAEILMLPTLGGQIILNLSRQNIDPQTEASLSGNLIRQDSI